MLRWIVCVFAALVIEYATGTYTQEHCDRIQFNFNNVPEALAHFRACSDLEPRKHPTELAHKFAICWAKFAAEKGLGDALQVLNNKEVRRILIPSEEWNGIVSRHMSASDCKDTNQTVRSIQILIIVILVTQIMVIVYLARTASDLADKLTLNFDPSRHELFR